METLTRREFLKRSLSLGCGFLLSQYMIPSLIEAAIRERKGIKVARYWIKIDEETVQCLLCPRKCILMNGVRSFCRVREPYKGTLYTLVYQTPCAVHVDPIEKKPIFHMLPGSKAFSIATAGCNLRCKFCQNWQISQSPPEKTENYYLPCEEVVNLALKYKCASIAYTYSEPTVFYEYMLDTQKIARSKGLKGIYVTAGYINPEPARELSHYIDAANVDLKGFNEKYLREVCAQELEPLLETLKLLKREGVWVEVTNLIVPTLNDDMDMIRKMCAWIKENMGDETPLHFSRFWPMYKLKNLPPTPVSTLEKARAIAMEVGLKFVYIGNVPGHKGNNTYCPRCHRILIQRIGYQILQNNLKEGKCKYCGYPIPGVWE